MSLVMITLVRHVCEWSTPRTTQATKLSWLPSLFPSLICQSSGKNAHSTTLNSYGCLIHYIPSKLDFLRIVCHNTDTEAPKQSDQALPIQVLTILINVLWIEYLQTVIFNDVQTLHHYTCLGCHCQHRLYHLEHLFS